MEISLSTKPKKNAVIISGFPGLGLVSTIATEFLIDHLNAKSIGKITSDKIPPMAAIHKGNVLDPFGIFYAEKENIVIIRGMFPIRGGTEWELTNSVEQFAKNINAGEIISLEGIGADSKMSNPEAFYFATDKKIENKFKSLNIKKLDEGIILGLTAVFLTKMPRTTFIFAETHIDMPDSRAAAKTIEVLDKYLGLNVDYKPLLKKALEVEEKIKDLFLKSMTAAKNKEQKESYVG